MRDNNDGPVFEIMRLKNELRDAYEEIGRLKYLLAQKEQPLWVGTTTVIGKGITKTEGEIGQEGTGSTVFSVGSDI